MRAFNSNRSLPAPLGQTQLKTSVLPGHDPLGWISHPNYVFITICAATVSAALAKPLQGQPATGSALVKRTHSPTGP